MAAIFAAVAFSSLLATHGLAAPTDSSGGDVLWELTNVAGTIYYDLSHNSICGQPGAMFSGAGPDWSWTGGGQINTQGTMCQDQNVFPLGDIGSENIIAMDRNVMKGDLHGWCGKEVKIFDQNGALVKAKDGKPFVLWDGCEACIGKSLIDMSVMNGLPLTNSPDCKGNNPQGLAKVQVLSNNVWPPSNEPGWKPVEKPYTTRPSNAGITGVPVPVPAPGAPSVTAVVPGASPSAGAGASLSAGGGAAPSPSPSPPGSGAAGTASNSCGAAYKLGADVCVAGSWYRCNYLVNSQPPSWQLLGGTCPTSATKLEALPS